MIPGILGAAGISGIANLIGGADQNAANQRSVEQQEQFQERMRDTAWLSATTGMKAAGLNPALAYSQGPASTPGGSTYQAQNVMGNAANAAIGTATSAQDVINKQQQIDVMGSQIANIDADTAKKDAEAINIKQNTSASKTGQATATPKAKEMDVISDLYNKYPSLLKAKAVFDMVTGSMNTGLNTANKIGEAAEKVTPIE